MKKHILLLAVLASGFTATAQKAQLSPLTRHYVHELTKQGSKAKPEGFAYRRGADGIIYMSAMVKVANAATAEQSIQALGGKIGTRAGDIWTVKVPYENAVAFTQCTGLTYIQLDEPVYPQLEAARKKTRVDSVHAGYSLPMPYTGRDVIVGVIDFGFDYNHPTFYDTTGMRYRVQKVWELNTNGTPPSGYTYGHEITDSNAIRAQGTDDVEQTHGTAVAGMAAGSGVGGDANARKYRGMAYESDMIFVGVRRDDIGSQWMEGSFSDFVDGVNYIFTQSTAAAKPAVVNISWGSQSGPHDGTTLVNQAYNNLSGAGKVVVMSAGNEGQENIHLNKTFTASDTLLQTFLGFTSPDYKRTWIDAWGQPGKTFCIQATLYHNGVAGNTTNFVCIDDAIHDLYLIADNGLDTCYAQFITSSAEAINNKPRMTVNIYNKATDSVGIAIKAMDGTVHAWNEYYYYGYTHGYQSDFRSLNKPWAVTGNTNSTVSDMGAGESVMLVGAYASKVDFVDINGNNWSYAGYCPENALVPFSSHGPMVDGRIKPDITAPGLTICTSMSSYDTAYTPTGSNSDLTIKSYTHPTSGKTFYYAEFTGTSASGPAASGIVALMLQANPTLTPQQVKDIVFETAIKDVYTSTIPAQGNNFWGHGKINAYGALKKIVQSLNVYNFTGRKLDCVLFPNPNKGSFTLDYTGEKAETVNISLYNTSGVLVYNESKHVERGSNLIPLSFKNLATGTYVVKVSTAEGMVGITTQVQ